MSDILGKLFGKDKHSSKDKEKSSSSTASSTGQGGDRGLLAAHNTKIADFCG